MDNGETLLERLKRFVNEDDNQKTKNNVSNLVDFYANEGTVSKEASENSDNALTKVLMDIGFNREKLKGNYNEEAEFINTKINYLKTKIEEGGPDVEKFKEEAKKYLFDW